jgi:hypothetical protein
MKRYLQKLTAADRKAWRQWQAGWICFYIVIAAALMGIGSLAPRPGDAELTQSVPINHVSLSKQPDGVRPR